MILLNFAHPLTAEQTGREITRTVLLPVQFDPEQPSEPQARALMAAIPLSPDELQTEALLVSPPSLNFITALVLAELHGRMGYFPAIVRLRPVEGSLPRAMRSPRFSTCRPSATPPATRDMDRTQMRRGRRPTLIRFLSACISVHLRPIPEENGTHNNAEENGMQKNADQR